MPELKPCPFCGGEANYQGFELNNYCVYCRRCGSSTRKYYATKEEASEAWNRRVDVAPVRHGRWECTKPCPVCGEDRFKGLDADIWADWEPPYCPNCGAKMDGGDDNAAD